MRRIVFLLLLGLVGAGAAWGQDLAATYRQVARPHISQSATIENVAFDWDAFHYKLNRGSIALTAPIEGRGITAIFTGDGEVDLTPPTPTERAQLQLFRGHDKLAEPFSQAVFRFADQAAFLTALGDQVHFHPTDEQAPFAAIVEERAGAIEHQGLPVAARILQSLDGTLDGPAAGRLMLADLKGTNGWFAADFDPMQPEAVRVHAWSQAAVRNPWSGLRRMEHFDPQAASFQPGEDPCPNPLPPVTANCQAEADLFLGEDSTNPGDITITGFDDTWTQFPALHPAAVPTWSVRDYQLHVNLTSAGDLAGNLALQVAGEAAVEGGAALGRGVYLELDANMRVSAASINGAAVEWVQPRDPGDVRDTGYLGDWLYVRLPAGATLPATLHIEYGGRNAIVRAGEKNYFLRSSNWTPRGGVAPLPPASYDLHFAGDGKFTIVGGDGTAPEWKSVTPVTEAGFAMGAFTVKDPAKTAGTTPVTVYANSQPSNQLQSVNAKVIKEDLPNPTTGQPACKGLGGGEPCRPIGTLDATRGSGHIQEEAVNIVKFMQLYFGAFPYPGLTVVSRPAPDIQGDPVTNMVAGAGGLNVTTLGLDGEHWPPLLMLNELAFLDETQQLALGTVYTVHHDPRDTYANLSRQLDETLEAHEIAHTWYDSQVGWAAPRDQWMSEGFANLAALLYEESRFGEGHAMETLAQWRMELMKEDQFGHTPVELGPLTLGARLASSKDPWGYQTVTYDKGGYVMYMLREYMIRWTDKEDDSDFIAMMRDFMSTYAGKRPSTEDFKAMVEKHMTPVMDLDGNHKMDWFFNEYVYGAGAPKLTFHAALKTRPDGKTAITLTVANPDNWRGLLPVYLVGLDGHYVRAMLKVDQPQITSTLVVFSAPKSVEANRFQAILVDVNQ